MLNPESIPNNHLKMAKKPSLSNNIPAKNISTTHHQIYGTTIYIGSTNLKTIYGQMVAYAFQDLIHKGYIIALAHGNIHAPTLYTRLHSSCVTSELMRSLDCDCKQQLNGAIKKICSSDGILFYLIQQGRGCGYVGKSRACMNVQFYEQQRDINTFEAYEMLGMQHDYRQYTDVKDILKILNISPQFILLTNNPDKIEKFTKLGIKLKSVESIQVEPNPFNQTYLVSKQLYGHILFQAKQKVQKYQIPYQRIQPFMPYSIPNAQRFVHVSSYYLPLKPVWNHILLTPQQYSSIFKKANIPKSYQLVRDPARNNAYSYYTQLTQQQINSSPQSFSKPNWFQINVHYDIVTHYDYLVLKYGDCKEPNKVPIVRIHSENLLNRFPLMDHQYEDRYKRALDMIIRNGCGLVMIFYNDGRGSGFGYYVLNTLKQSIEERNLIGVEDDKRDYFGAIKLLKHYLNEENQVDVLTGQTSFAKLSKEFYKSHVKVRKYIKLSNESERQGIHSIQQRMRSLKNSVQHMTQNLDLKSFQKACELISKFIQKNNRIYSTGIGSSEAHSRALSTLFSHKIIHLSPTEVTTLDSQKDLLIVFSQNLSPNMMGCLNEKDFRHLILVTTLNPEEHFLNKKKQDMLEKLKSSGTIFVCYPSEGPDNTLVRVTGPLIGYYINGLLKMVVQSNQISEKNIQKSISHFMVQFVKLHDNLIIPCDQFIEALSQQKNLIICCDSPAYQLSLNLSYKMLEGCMLNTHLTSYINFSHGPFQFIENSQDYCVWFITKKENNLHQKTIEMINLSKQRINVTNYEQSEWLPLSLELEGNHCMLQLIQLLKVNQCEWPGKARQHVVYDIGASGEL